MGKPMCLRGKAESEVENKQVRGLRGRRGEKERGGPAARDECMGAMVDILHILDQEDRVGAPPCIDFRGLCFPGERCTGIGCLPFLQVRGSHVVRVTRWAVAAEQSLWTGCLRWFGQSCAMEREINSAPQFPALFASRRAL
ncbi:hypothetical protein GQ54DRAFT_115106 [Martensiomyces pterosporus]|nr:hypothetical protein GQ54DRAFT_115106 [Martensiomyces pterosporus]